MFFKQISQNIQNFICTVDKNMSLINKHWIIWLKIKTILSRLNLNTLFSRLKISNKNNLVLVIFFFSEIFEDLNKNCYFLTWVFWIGILCNNYVFKPRQINLFYLVFLNLNNLLCLLNRFLSSQFHIFWNVSLIQVLC